MADETRLITVKRGTKTQWANEIAPLEAGELGYDSTNKQYKGGEGAAYDELPEFIRKTMDIGPSSGPPSHPSQPTSVVRTGGAGVGQGGLDGNPVPSRIFLQPVGIS